MGACKSCDHDGPGGDDAGHAQPTSLTPEQAKQVLVRFADGETITLGDYAAALEHMDQFNRLRYQSAERRKELLDEMINVRLLAKEAEAKGYDKDPLTQEELRAILRDSMLQEARKGAPSPAEIPESEVRAWFEAHRAEYKDPERRRLSLVVLRVTRGDLAILPMGSTQEVFRTRLDALDDVVLETKTIERHMDTAAGAVNIGMGGLTPSIAAATDTNRIALVPAEGDSHVLTKDYFGHAESVEQFAKVRTFLRSMGWIPLSERGEDDDDVNEEEEDDEPVSAPAQ